MGSSTSTLLWMKSMLLLHFKCILFKRNLGKLNKKKSNNVQNDGHDWGCLFWRREDCDGRKLSEGSSWEEEQSSLCVGPGVRIMTVRHVFFVPLKTFFLGELCQGRMPAWERSDGSWQKFFFFFLGLKSHLMESFRGWGIQGFEMGFGSVIFKGQSSLQVLWFCSCWLLYSA